MNEDSWRIDGKYLFDPVEVEKIKEAFTYEGISINEASRKFDVSLHYLKKFIKDGKLSYKLYVYQNKETVFVKPEDVENLLHSESYETVYAYSRKHEVVLFQKRGDIFVKQFSR
ncbi:MAG: hypothetical protein ACI35O_03335 [Bacillaceae bacterium]